MICPRCASPNFNRVGSYGRGIKANYFECKDCGYAEENGRSIKGTVHKYKKCPRCSSKYIKPAYRHLGYYECEECGKEWKQGGGK